MISIITATYNRAHLLERVYDSLRNQSCKDFEWIVVDDDSTDDTEFRIRSLLEKCQFPMRYFKVPHGGKHRAVNFGVKVAKGEGILTVDSDDYLTKDAIEFLNPRLKQIMHDNKIAAVAGLRCEKKNVMSCKEGLKFSGFIDATNLERRKYGLQKDKAEVYKKDIYLRYPYPEYDGEDFLSEGVMRNRVANDGYYVRWYDHLIEYTDYLSDGLTRNIFLKQYENPLGWADNLATRIECGDSFALRETIHYYILMQQKFDKRKICELLRLSDQEIVRFDRYKDVVIRRINSIFYQQKNRDFALYGMGLNAQYLIQYLKIIGKKPLYGIDRMAENIVYNPTFHLEDNLPKVDMVIITPNGLGKDEVANIKEVIKYKMPDVIFMRFTDIFEDLDSEREI